MTKHIHGDADRRWPVGEVPERDDEEAMAKDWTRGCETCGETPVVNVTGLCGPCTFGEADTIGGNW